MQGSGTIDRKKAYSRFRIWRIFIPIFISLIVFGYLFYQKFDWQEFEQIEWTSSVYFLIGVGLILLLGRIFSYAHRLRLLSLKQFSLRKCIQLIFIWEFSSAISPTNVGGSAVALFVLSQEKIGAARTATIVLYTVILDTILFVFGMLIWLFLFGTKIIDPDSTDSTENLAITFFIAFTIMIIYGCFFFYGTFIQPVHLKRFTYWLGRQGLLKRFGTRLRTLGDHFEKSSLEMKGQPLQFHVQAFLWTAAAWSCRFLLICVLVVAFSTASFDLLSFMELGARIHSIFVIMAFSPTPGGAGFAEFLFSDSLRMYFTGSVGLVVVSIWRLLAYYFFLFAGIFVIPHWVNTVVLKKKRNQSDQVLQEIENSEK